MKHVVEQGEYLSLIAARYGIKDWREIYEHADNAELRKKRPNPNVLHPGDVIEVPAIRPAQVSVATGRSHTFVVKKVPVDELHLVLQKRGRAIARESCAIEFTDAGERVLKGMTATTSAEGELKAAIPRGATHARITVEGKQCEWRVAIGHLDPIRDHDAPFEVANCKASGIQARLINLGLLSGDVDGEFGPRTTEALKRFQTKVMGRDGAEGALDEATCDALEDAHAGRSVEGKGQR